MNRVSILVFHPLMHKSRVNQKLALAVDGMEGVSTRFMYDIYPDFYIDVKKEQEVLLESDTIVWQHPFYWYSSPSLLKEWIDLVLEHGFAYGRKGRALEGKQIMSTISTGGRREAYLSDEDGKFSVRQLLAPFEQTTTLCRMNYLSPFVTHGTHLLDENGIGEAASGYAKVIGALRDGLYSTEELRKHEYINDLIL
ncbi:MAG: NAD(P)H-dependent oxidoreductase [Bacteroidales bacterium]|nr:NAD(P)H-dependent oxidoreductase [Bacteroidales bacterium]